MSSYQAQIDYYKKYITENTDYIFSGIYADEGISGTNIHKRNAFKQLMQDCRDSKIDMIITKSLSRFGRNTLDCLNSIRELKALGVDVFFEKENIHTMRSEGEMLLTFISAVAQNESLTLSENVKWGIHRKYERGHIQSIPSGKFLGYDKDDTGNLVVNEVEAATVRRIYQEFLDGYGYYQIAKHLTEDGVPTERGSKVWCWGSLKKILTNEKYMGDTLCQKTYNYDHLTKRRVKNKGELPQYYYEDTHPAIINKETWKCVQLEFERQSQYTKAHHISTYHRHCEEFPLSAKVTCSHCGHTFVLRESMRSKDLGQKYWICKNFREGRYSPRSNDNCDNGTRIAADVPEKAFISAWNSLVDEYESYLQEWQQVILVGDELQRYRAKEIIRIVKNIGKIDTMPYELMLKTLDHIEIGSDGTVEVIFLAGTRISV